MDCGALFFPIGFLAGVGEGLRDITLCDSNIIEVEPAWPNLPMPFLYRKGALL